MGIKKLLFLFSFILLGQSCSHVSSFTSIPPDAAIVIGKTNISGITPQNGSISNTTFGRYYVKVQKEDYAPIYSDLPLKVDPGMIAVDVLLCAPCAFFNVQKSLPEYEFDLEKGVIKYKISNKGEWLIYNIPKGQEEAARSFFNKQF